MSLITCLLRNESELTLIEDDSSVIYEFIIYDFKGNAYLTKRGDNYTLPAVIVPHDRTYSDCVEEHVKQMFPTKRRNIYTVSCKNSVVIVVFLKQNIIKKMLRRKRKQEIYTKVNLYGQKSLSYLARMYELMMCTF